MNTSSSAIYQSGFGNHFTSESAPGLLPEGMNSPQRLPHGLYAEQLSGTAFTSIRSENRKTWLYRRRPSVQDVALTELSLPSWHTAPIESGLVSPRPLRWTAWEGAADEDFVHSIRTIAANGRALDHMGVAVHVYHATRSMTDSAFMNSDGELLIVPQSGRLRIDTEVGPLDLEPKEVAVVPRGMVFRVTLLDEAAKGYVLENYGAMLRLPELGPIGANGLANPRDFQVPAARAEADRPTGLITKLGGRFWRKPLPFTPFDVLAWHGNLTPYKYSLTRFNTFGSVSFDSPDPSVNTVLTSPSHLPGTAEFDFVCFPPRWQVAEGSFRPPFFHRNVMTEFMGLIEGEYEGKGRSFSPGGGSLHVCMTPHGPDLGSYERGVSEPSVPNKLDHTYAFMFETRLPLVLVPGAVQVSNNDTAYTSCWSGFVPASI